MAMREPILTGEDIHTLLDLLQEQVESGRVQPDIVGRLRQAHQQFQSTLDSITDGLLILDRDWRYTYFSETGARMLGLRPEDLIGGCVWDLFPHAKGTKFHESYHRAVATGQPVHFEEFYPEPLNKWLECHCYPSAEGLTVYFRDITGRKRTEEALRESEEHARRIIDNTVALVGIMTPDGTLIEANTTALSAGGLRREEVVGKKFWDCYWWSYDPQVQNQLRDAVTKAAGGHKVRYDVVVRMAHDSRMHIDFMLAPVRNSTGHVTHLIPSAIDITDRKKSEEDLRHTAERYEQQLRLFDGVTSTTPDFVYLFDPQGRFLYANSRLLEVWGMELPDVIGKTCRELGYEQWHHDMHMREIAQVIETRRSIKGEVPFKAPLTGIFGVYEYIFTPVIGPDGEVEFIAGTTRDTTERKQAENDLKEAKAAAEEANRAKSEFLANMSHEIRTPMTVFMAAIEHLLQIDRSPERRHLLGIAEQSAQRLRSLIDDILDFSRIEAQRVDLEEEEFELRACVREAIDLFVLSARAKNLRLEMQVAPDSPQQVFGDAGRLGQVLINLIGNAVKFTHEGKIRVDVQPRGEYLEFAVADTGIGIPEEKRDRLFQSFSQVDSSFTRKFGGTGLGLAICKGLVELMGGQIRVQSREGQGSVFTFTVPLKTAAKKKSVSAETASGHTGKESAAARILLAEDEPMIRDMITMVLVQQGWQAQTAESGQEAVEKWATGDFDIVLMDLQMPELNGLEATQMIREREAEGGKRTTIIGLTAHTRREIKEECLASGMDQVLTKPVKIQELLSAVGKCL
jgi:PAS domain S-box-containing protein